MLAGVANKSNSEIGMTKTSMTSVAFSDNYNLKIPEEADSTLNSKHGGRLQKSRPAPREVPATRLISVAWSLLVSRGVYLNARIS